MNKNNWEAIRSVGFYAFCIGAGLVCVLLAGGLPLALLAPIPSVDIICLLLCYFFLKKGAVASFLAATGFGWAVDVYSGAAHGIFMLCYASAFGACYVASLFLDIDHPKGQILFVLAAALARRMAFIPASVIFPSGRGSWDGLFFMGVLSSFLTAALAPGFFFALERVRAALGVEEER